MKLEVIKWVTLAGPTLTLKVSLSAPVAVFSPVFLMMTGKQKQIIQNIHAKAFCEALGQTNCLRMPLTSNVGLAEQGEA